MIHLRIAGVPTNSGYFVVDLVSVLGLPESGFRARLTRLFMIQLCIRYAGLPSLPSFKPVFRLTTTILPMCKL